MCRTLLERVLPLELVHLLRDHLHLLLSKPIMQMFQLPPAQLQDHLALMVRAVQPLPPHLRQLWLLPLLLAARWVDFGGNLTYLLRLDQTLLRESIDALLENSTD
jgi:hypothetical protein